MREWWASVRALGLSLGVHLLAALLIVLGTMDWEPFRPPQLQGLMIEAVIVDTTALRERREQAQREARQAVEREQARERRETELAAQRERERQAKLEAERQAKLEAERQRARQQREEQMRLQQLRERQEREREQQLKRQQEELERIQQERAAAERQRRLEEERLKQVQARRQAEEDARLQAELEAERQRAIAAEQQAFRAGRLATLGEQYILAIQAQVTNNWLRPPTARPGLRCTLRIIQIPGGEVISAAIVGQCNADEATRRSLVAAVERAGSLPYRGFEEVFEREIDFVFRYDGD